MCNKYTKYLLCVILSTFLLFSHSLGVYADPIGPWVQTSSLPNTLASQGFVSDNSKLYIIAGANIDDYAEVLSSEVQSNGEITPWEVDSLLPETRFWHAIAKKDNNIYVLGGSFYPGSIQERNTVYVGSIESNGISWQSTTSLPSTRNLGAAAIVGDRIYFAGGGNSLGQHDEVFVSDINSDGSLGNWIEANNLPIPLAGLALISYQNNLLAIGGYNNSIGDSSKVYKTSVDIETGLLSPWTEVAELPIEINRAGVVNKDNLLFVIGGGTTSYLNTIYYTKINSDGTIEPWSLSKHNLPISVNAGAAAVVDNYLYFSGGHDGGYYDDVYYAEIIEIIKEPVALLPLADTYVKQGSPNQNEGASTFMRLQSSGNNRSLIKFNQSEIEDTIGNSQNYTAKLQLTITDNGNNWGPIGREVNIHKLTTDWREGNGFIVGNSPTYKGIGLGATWNCAIDSDISNQNDDCSGSTSWTMSNITSLPFAPSVTDTTTITNNQSGSVEFDVTADIQSFLSGESENYGWIIKKVSEGQSGRVHFGTRESSAAPQLIITFNP